MEKYKVCPKLEHNSSDVNRFLNIGRGEGNDIDFSAGLKKLDTNRNQSYLELGSLDFMINLEIGELQGLGDGMLYLDDPTNPWNIRLPEHRANNKVHAKRQATGEYLDKDLPKYATNPRTPLLYIFGDTDWGNAGNPR